MNLNFYKTCFKITAVGNVIAAVAAIASMQTHIGLAYGEVEINPLLRFYHYNFWVFVLLLGVAYWYLAKEPFRYRIIALIGGIGKLIVAASFLHLALNGHAKPLTLFGIAYDGFFGIVLLVFFFFAKDPEQ